TEPWAYHADHMPSDTLSFRKIQKHYQFDVEASYTNPAIQKYHHFQVSAEIAVVFHLQQYS
ncbi:hypothetical protein AE930_16825, partial [Xanthomonas arboricola]